MVFIQLLVPTALPTSTQMADISTGSKLSFIYAVTRGFSVVRNCMEYKNFILLFYDGGMLQRFAPV